MVMMAQPFCDTFDSIVKDLTYNQSIYLSYRRVLNQQMVRNLHRKALGLLCGHYEGIDERIIEIWTRRYP